MSVQRSHHGNPFQCISGITPQKPADLTLIFLLKRKGEREVVNVERWDERADEKKEIKMPFVPKAPLTNDG